MNKVKVKGIDKNAPQHDKEISIQFNGVVNDIILWIVSIILSVLPVMLKQFCFPTPIFEDMSFFSRLMSDINFAYAFLIASAILIIQVLLTVPNRVKKRVGTIFITLSSIFDFTIFLFYNCAMLFDYEVVESLMKKGEVGSVRDANVSVLISTIVISIVCIYLHSSSTDD